MKFLTTHASMHNTMTFSRHWLKRLVRVLSTEQLIMAKGTKAASGSRGSARPGPGVGGVMKKPAGAKKNPSALLDPGRSAQRARHWSHAEAERQVVQLLDERLHMRKAIRRALGHSKTAVLALCDAFEDGALAPLEPGQSTLSGDRRSLFSGCRVVTSSSHGRAPKFCTILAALQC